MSGMRSLSPPIRIILVVVLLGLCYLPVAWLWGRMLPSYSRLIAAASESITNAIEFSDTSYRIAVDGSDFKVTARMRVMDGVVEKGRYEQSGDRPIDLVSYNLALWGALGLATILFVSAKARLRFLLIAPAIIIAWHLCDLMIFAKNTHWVLAKELHRQFPALVSYSFSWNWLWWWALELNRRIIDPFLPLALWLMFCLRSFLTVLSHRNVQGR